jgi:two-component system sensor histidine kinase KdpD
MGNEPAAAVATLGTLVVAHRPCAALPGHRVNTHQTSLPVHPTPDAHHAAATLHAGPGRLLVWLGNNVHADELVRHARQLAQAAGLPWTAICIDTPGAGPGAGEAHSLALQALNLAERLGATVHHDHAGSVLEAIVARVQREQATILLIGDHVPQGWLQGLRRHWLGSIADALSARLPELTVHVVQFPAAAVRAAPASDRPAAWPALRSGTLRAAVVVGLCTAIAELMLPFTDRASVVMVYMAGVVYVALRMGQAAAMLSVVLSILVFDLLMVEPRWSFAPLDPQYYLTFLVMLIVGVLISRLVAQVSLQAELAEARARRAQALSDLARHLVAAHSAKDVGEDLAEAVQTTFGVPSALLLPDAQGRLQDPRAFCSAEELRQAQALVAGHGSAGETAPGGATQLQVLLQGSGDVLGVLAVRPLPGGIGTPEDRRLLDAMADQAALALERALYEQRSVHAVLEAETERLRNTLLSGISHDFRTPLTTIIGAASSLLDQDHVLDTPRRRMLLEGLLGEARRVHGSMSDLLDLTRMEEGRLRPLLEWCPVDDLVQEVRDALGQRLAAHRFEVQVSAEAIVWCDPRLIVQAAVNLVDNALRHTPAGGRVALQVRVQPSTWELSVSDDGPGLPPGHEQTVFKKFSRARADGVGSGTGLGLAICAAVARLHDGQIEARNAGGARFTLALPQPPLPGTLGSEYD